MRGGVRLATASLFLTARNGRLLVCGASSHASRQNGDLGNEDLVFVTPADDQFVAYQRLVLPVCASE